MMRVRAFATLPALILVVLLGGCAMSGLLPNWLSEDVAGPEPQDYRFAVAVRLKEIVGNGRPGDTLEITAPRRVDDLKGASWIVCLKAQKFPLLPRYYAVIFQRGQIVNSRLSVLIDRCEVQSFSAYDWNAALTPAGALPRAPALPPAPAPPPFPGLSPPPLPTFPPPLPPLPGL